jgi:hypothetical protein
MSWHWNDWMYGLIWEIVSDWLSEWVSENMTTREAIASKNTQYNFFTLQNWLEIWFYDFVLTLLKRVDVVTKYLDSSCLKVYLTSNIKAQPRSQLIYYSCDPIKYLYGLWLKKVSIFCELLPQLIIISNWNSCAKLSAQSPRKSFRNTSIRITTKKKCGEHLHWQGFRANR